VRGLLFSFLRENTVNNFFGATVVKIVVRERRARLSSGLLVFLGRKTYRLPYMSAKRHKVSEEDAIGDLHVLGSVVFDLLFSPKSLPTPGMTVLSKNVKKAAGGKGANQAYAAGKALSSSSPSSVSFFGCVGEDEFGEKSLDSLKSVGVNTDNVHVRKEEATAMASVVIDEKGENQICVGSSANNLVNAKEWIEIVEKHKQKPVALLLQMEIPPSEVFEAIRYCSENDIISILNAAPADEPIPTETLEMLNILIVNEHEVLQVRDSVLREGYAMAVPKIYSDGHNDDAELSTDVTQDARAVAHQLARSFELVVIVTLGEEGCAAVLPVRPTDNDAPSGEESDAIDTIYSSALKNLKDGEKIVSAVGAGDAFVGAFCSYLIEGKDMHTCLRAASACGTLACLSNGAREGVPTRQDLDERMQDVELLGVWGKQGISKEALQRPAVDWCRLKK
jgi:ribokinase